jgi:hypothetical protein
MIDAVDEGDASAEAALEWRQQLHDYVLFLVDRLRPKFLGLAHDEVRSWR